MAATMIARMAGDIATALPRDLLRPPIDRNVCRAEEPILPTARPRAQRGRRRFAAVIPDMRPIWTATETEWGASERFRSLDALIADSFPDVTRTAPTSNSGAMQSSEHIAVVEADRYQDDAGSPFHCARQRSKCARSAGGRVETNGSSSG